MDLKHAYFHLGIADALKPYLCIQVEEKPFQFQAACFGLSTLPQQWQSVMKVFLKKMEKTRNLNLGLFGRHSVNWQQSPSSSKTFTDHSARFKSSWHGCKPKEVPASPSSTGGTVGFHDGSQKRMFASTSRKDEENKKGIGKNSHSFTDDLQKNGSHSWCHKKFSHGNALFKGFHRPTGPICKPTGKDWLGQKSPNSFNFARAGERNEYSNGAMERKNFSGKNPSKGTSFGFLAGGLGWSRCNQWKISPRILERQKGAAHQRERIGGSHKHSAIIGKGKRTCPSKSGQFGDVCLFGQGWGKDPKFKSTSQAISKVVHGKENIFDCPTSQKFRGFGGWPQQMAQGQRGLYHGQKPVSLFVTENEKGQNRSTGGHVCLPWQSPTPKICVQVPTLASNGSGCPQMSFGENPKLLCKPPMVNNWQMAAQIKGKQGANLHDDNTLLGFSLMVAPTSKTASQGGPSLSNPPISGDVQKLLGRIYATSQVAPDLCNLIRKSLQAKQVSSEAADTYVKSLKSLPRYGRAFKLFWAFCSIKGVNTTSATLTEIASMVLQFDKLMPTHGRHAYAALLLVPGLGQLQFEPLLRQVKRTWNVLNTRYVLFSMQGILLRSLLPCDWTGARLNNCAYVCCYAADFLCFAEILIWKGCSDECLQLGKNLSS